jgi:anti-anti-sigma factor
MDGPTLKLIGELDVATVPLLELMFHQSAARHRELRIDLSGTRFMDSVGLRCLISLARTPNRAMVLQDPSTPVQRLLDLALGEHQKLLSVHCSGETIGLRANGRAGEEERSFPGARPSFPPVNRSIKA